MEYGYSGLRIKKSGVGGINTLVHIIGGNEMKENKQYVYKWYRKAELCLIIHIACFVLNIVFLALIQSNTPKELYIGFFFTTVFIHIAVFSCMWYFGWYSAVYLNDEKIWTRIAGKNYEWRWDEMTQCAVREHKFLGLPLFVPFTVTIKTGLNYKELSFSHNKKREKQFLKLCSNEDVKEQLVNNPINRR